MTGVEVNMVTSDSPAALVLYEAIFGDGVERVEVTALPRGQNEAVFILYGTRIHMLDENPEFGMVVPKEGDPKPIWLNVVVPDIASTWKRAMEAGCTEIQPVTEIPSHGVSNAMFSDPYGYIWLLHQIHREVSFEERMAYYETGQS